MRRLSRNRSEPAKISRKIVAGQQLAEQMVETLAELPFIGDQRVVAPELFEPFFADARAGCSGVFVTLPIAGPVPDRIEVPGDDVRSRHQRCGHSI